MKQNKPFPTYYVHALKSGHPYLEKSGKGPTITFAAENNAKSSYKRQQPCLIGGVKKCHLWERLVCVRVT